MGLNFNTIRVGVLSTLLSLSAAGCKKAPTYKVLPHEFIPARTINSLDSIRKSGIEITSNPEFQLLGVDTVKIDKKFMLNPKKFMAEQNKALENKYKESVVTGTHVDTWSDADGTALVYVNDYAPKYIDKTTVVKSKNLYTKDYNDTYLPVEYYGRINPEAAPFLKKDDRTVFQRIKDLFK